MADGEVKIAITADDSDAEKELKDIEGAAEDAADGLDDLGKKGEEAGKGLDVADMAAGNFVSDGLMNMIGGLKDAVAGLFELAESTREFRDDMAKLDTAFTDAGHSTDTAKSAYSDFYAILGESDRSVEAVNHLAELTKNEKELADWSTIAAGVTAKFGDSLPIEGLTEAANETAKVGAVTGPLADALNWAGISEEEFNKQLEKCNSEQERASLITSTLNKEYSDAAAKYNEMTKSTQDARRATAEMEEAQANIGAALEPVTTAWTNMKAQAFEAMLPIIEGVVGAFQSINQWMDENPGKAEVVKAVLIGLAAAFGVLAVALSIGPIISIVTAAFSALNLTMLMNPITLIVAALAALVAAFLYLWNNCEAFREFWINLWEKIKAIASVAWEAIKGFFSAAWDYIKGVWDAVQPYFSALWEAIKKVFSVVKDVLGRFFKSAWEFIKGVWDKVKPYFSALWEGIKKVFSVVKDVLGAYFSTAWDAIKLVWSAATGFFQNIWNTIKGIFAVVKAVLSGNFKDAWEAIKGVFVGWKDYFTGLWNNVKEVFSGAKEKFMEIGGNIVAGIRQGISNAWSNLKEWFKGLFGDLIGVAKKILGIESPSKEFAYIGEMTGEGMGVGWKKSIGAVEKDMIKQLSEMQPHLLATINAENARIGRSSGTADTGFADLARAVGIQTAGINSLAGEYRRGTGTTRPIILQLDKRELGRAVVDVGSAENVRVGSKLALGGA